LIDCVKLLEGVAVFGSPRRLLVQKREVDFDVLEARELNLRHNYQGALKMRLSSLSICMSVSL
jgi:hypothetical protein